MADGCCPPGDDGWGLLDINGTLYRLLEVNYFEPNRQPRMLVRLLRAGAECEYVLSPDCDGTLRCDCADAIYRQHERCCKHVRGVTAAYEILREQRRLSDVLDDATREPDGILADDDGRVPCPACEGRGDRFCVLCDGIGEVARPDPPAAT